MTVSGAKAPDRGYRKSRDVINNNDYGAESNHVKITKPIKMAFKKVIYIYIPVCDNVKKL